MNDFYEMIVMTTITTITTIATIATIQDGDYWIYSWDWVVGIRDGKATLFKYKLDKTFRPITPEQVEQFTNNFNKYPTWWHRQ